MNKIKITNPNNGSDFFEIPWEWINVNDYTQILNDLEASAERGKLTGKLSRKRLAEIPSASIPINKRLKQEEVFPLLKLLKLVKLNITYFEPYLNKFVTREFYATKPQLKIYQLPLDNNTNNILYDKFSIELIGYGDVN